MTDDTSTPHPVGAPPRMVGWADRQGYHRIAYHRLAASRLDGARLDERPGLVFFGGFRSTMDGAKAQALAGFAAAQGLACLRFDYSGHGASAGRFTDGTIGGWLREAGWLVRHLTSGPQIFVGSSMGGWIALLLARALRASGEGKRIAGFLLLAPAVDFTEELIAPRLSRTARTALARDGVWLRPSAYGATPDPITATLLAEGRRHLLLGSTVEAGAPVHIIHGLRDETVPWSHVARLVERLAGDPATVSLIRDGDHRLSRPEDLARMLAAVTALVENGHA